MRERGIDVALVIEGLRKRSLYHIEAENNTKMSELVPLKLYLN